MGDVVRTSSLNDKHSCKLHSPVLFFFCLQGQPELFASDSSTHLVWRHRPFSFFYLWAGRKSGLVSLAPTSSGSGLTLESQSPINTLLSIAIVNRMQKLPSELLPAFLALLWNLLIMALTWGGGGGGGGWGTVAPKIPRVVCLSELGKQPEF